MADIDTTIRRANPALAGSAHAARDNALALASMLGSQSYIDRIAGLCRDYADLLGTRLGPILWRELADWQSGEFRPSEGLLALADDVAAELTKEN